MQCPNGGCDDGVQYWNWPAAEKNNIRDRVYLLCRLCSARLAFVFGFRNSSFSTMTFSSFAMGIIIHYQIFPSIPSPIGPRTSKLFQEGQDGSRRCGCDWGLWMEEDHCLKPRSYCKQHLPFNEMSKKHPFCHKKAALYSSIQHIILF